MSAEPAEPTPGPAGVGDLTEPIAGLGGDRGSTDTAAHRPDDRWLTDPLESGPAAGFGVYVHVPFCAHRCGYCDFATYDDRDRLMPRYVAALHDDVARTVADGPSALAPPAASHNGPTTAPPGAAVRSDWPTVTSIFVGGGTPTRLPADDLAGLVERVRSELRVAPDAEITVEANPEDASPPLFARLAGAGVTRISMGAQSFAGHVLERLERLHDEHAPARAVADARAGGIDDVSLDLIYGTPGESDDDWARSLDGALAAGVDHVSAYALTIHDNTAFGRRVATGAMPAPDEDVQAERFETAAATLGGAGFEHYEVSNWARPGRRSRHNTLYWRHGDYLAFGVGAHGHLSGRRWWAPRTIERWLAAAEAERAPLAGEEHLTTGERAAERLLLGLRLREGIHARDVPPIDPEALTATVDAGLVTTACGRLQVTARGRYLVDEAVRRLA